MGRKTPRHQAPLPPLAELLPLVHGSTQIAEWLEFYWRKLALPEAHLRFLAVTNDRAEFARWTGRRLNPLALGCYCYLPLSTTRGTAGARVPTMLESSALGTGSASGQLVLPGFGAAPATATAPRLGTATDFRHLIFIEADLEALGTEVTVAHELIHLADRVHGTPRRHRCHGHDSIAADEATVTGRDPEVLRRLLAEETARREVVLRSRRPYRYIYECPACKKQYPRVRRYTRTVSCGRCDQHFNPAFLLQLRETLDPPSAE